MKTLIERLEAALGDAHDPVKVALTAGDVRALIAAHKAATAKAEGMEDVLVAKMAERDAAEAKLKALHEAAGAFLVALEKTVCSSFVYECRAGEAGCESVATRLYLHRGSMDPTCDYCVNVAVEADVISETDLKDLPIAAPLRALRAALKEEP